MAGKSVKLPNALALRALRVYVETEELLIRSGPASYERIVRPELDEAEHFLAKLEAGRPVGRKAKDGPATESLIV